MSACTFIFFPLPLSLLDALLQSSVTRGPLKVICQEEGPHPRHWPPFPQTLSFMLSAKHADNLRAQGPAHSLSSNSTSQEAAGAPWRAPVSLPACPSSSLPSRPALSFQPIHLNEEQQHLGGDTVRVLQREVLTEVLPVHSRPQVLSPRTDGPPGQRTPQPKPLGPRGSPNKFGHFSVLLQGQVAPAAVFWSRPVFFNLC